MRKQLMRNHFEYRRFLLLLFIFLEIAVIGCSQKNGGLDIHLPKGIHLSDHPSGFWMQELLHHSDDTTLHQSIGISEALLDIGEPIDKYRMDEHSFSIIYKVKTDNNSNYFKVSGSTGESSVTWITLLIDEPGIPWSMLIPNEVENLRPNRASEMAAVISSEADRGARLFLFGWGKYCKEISLVY
jgi:hypothetical protein